MQKPKAPSTWLELSIDRHGEALRVSARGSRGEQTPPCLIGSADQVTAMLRFGALVQQAAGHAKPMLPALLTDAQTTGEAVFTGRIGLLASRLREAAGGPLLLRLMVHDPELAAIAWEALCKPGEALGFWAGAPDLLPVRGVVSSEPWTPVIVHGAIRVLAIAPNGSTGLATLKSALQERIDAGEIEFLDPIEGLAAHPRHLFPRLRREPLPHVIHFVGHGGMNRGVASIRLDDGSEDDEMWLPVELLAQQLQSSFRGALRLVVLECCEGARPSAFASAAELLARGGADAVVAHLWPVRADVARTFSAELYRALVGTSEHAGNVAVAMNEARRILLGAFGGSAQAFSPVLYLRGSESIVFDFAPPTTGPTNLPSDIIASPLPSRRQEFAMPIATLVGMTSGQTKYLTNDTLLHLWRRARVRDELRFQPPTDGFYDGNDLMRVFRLGPGNLELFLGRSAEQNDHKNDLVVPHKKVSQQCLRITVHDGYTMIQRRPECRAQVLIGMHALEPGEQRSVHHGQIITIGHAVAGVFVDGRYTQPEVPPHTVDPMTGLLDREGIAWEVAVALRQNEPPRLFLVQPTNDVTNRESVASRIALALHAFVPAQPIARLDACVLMMLTDTDAVEPLFDLAKRSTGAKLVAGHYRVSSSSETASHQAAVCIEKARSAIERAMTLATPHNVVDLNQHTPVILDNPRFERDAAALLDRGGEMILVAMAERERLTQIGKGVCDALELELLEMLGRNADVHAILSRPIPGIVACAAPGALDQTMQKLAASWRALGPVRGDNIEVEREIYTEIVRAPDAPDVARRAVELASGPTLRIESLPAPLALHVRAALGATGVLEAATTLVELVRETVRFISIVLVSMLARSIQKLPVSRLREAHQTWREPWGSLVVQAAVTLADTPGRTGALVSTWFGPQGAPHASLASGVRLAERLQRALEHRPIDMAAIHREASAIPKAVDELITILSALRGWSLVAVQRSDALDPYRDAETLSYIDYTGSFEMGTSRTITLLSNRRVGPFVYLARFAEGIVVPLEPFARRRLCPECGMEELFWTDELIVSAGGYIYRNIDRKHTLQEKVELRDIPPALRSTRERSHNVAPPR